MNVPCPRTIHERLVSRSTTSRAVDLIVIASFGRDVCRRSAHIEYALRHAPTRCSKFKGHRCAPCSCALFLIVKLVHSDVSYVHLLQVFSLLKLMTDILLYTACIPHNTTEFPIIESTEKSLASCREL